MDPSTVGGGFGGLGMVVYLIGLIVTLVGYIMVLVKAFQKNAGWGIGSLLLFIPIGWIFGFMNWDTCKKGLGIWLVGIIIMIFASLALMPEAIQAG